VTGPLARLRGLFAGLANPLTRGKDAREDAGTDEGPGPAPNLVPTSGPGGDASGESESAVRVRDLVVDRGGRRALDGVDLDVAPGEFLAIVGPNGAGKTTLLRTVSGGLCPAEGRVTVTGERIHDLPSRAGSRLVATVPQEAPLSFDFDVRTAVEMGRTPHVGRFEGFTDRDRRAVDRALARASVDPLADRPVTALSGGERRRVLLARALAQDTPVVLLDEPTASLDVAHAVRTLDLVCELRSEGRTVLAAVHDLNLAARFADRIAVLADGAVEAVGPPEAVLTESTLGAAFDVDAVVGPHPVTDSVLVTPVGATDRPPSAEDATPSAGTRSE
jgi:iron complex transport system ATP-binding protein